MLPRFITLFKSFHKINIFLSCNIGITERSPNGRPAAGTQFQDAQPETALLPFAPQLSDPSLFEQRLTQSYHQALRDPLLRTLPYVLETYRILETCYRQPAYRIMEPAGHPEEGYLFKFYCQDAFGPLSSQITCRVLFFEHRVLFTSPVLNELEAALQHVLLLKAAAQRSEQIARIQF